jgi:hypothetical protein
MVGATICPAQTPTLQDVQAKLLQFEESSQRTIAELKAEMAALQQGQKPLGVVPPAPVASQTQEVPEVRTPVEYYGTETRTRQTAGDNEVGAPRNDNDPLGPELRGFFHLPGTSTYMKFGGFVKTDLLYDLNYASRFEKAVERKGHEDV